MGMVVRLNQSEKGLRNKIEELDAIYDRIAELSNELDELQWLAFGKEIEYHKELKRHVQCMGRENVSKDLFDYTIEEDENRLATAGRPGED